MTAKCAICGEPMPDGEEMFKFHGYSGPCPKPPLPKAKIENLLLEATKAAYRKHHIGDDSLGWQELSDILFYALTETMGDGEFSKWLSELDGAK
ncbi:MAG TPA: hypothetical protein DDY86_03890 [Syntrophaceae bacterium]|nr:hypothetical protein [Syntrophaceae bacterium]